MRLFAGAVNIGKKDTRSAVNDWIEEAGVYSPETVEDFFQGSMPRDCTGSPDGCGLPGEARSKLLTKTRQC